MPFVSWMLDMRYQLSIFLYAIYKFAQYSALQVMYVSLTVDDGPVISVLMRVTYVAAVRRIQVQGRQARPADQTVVTTLIWEQHKGFSMW